MRYAQIRKTDIANGEGIRVSLYVQGCHRHCFNCFNQETWEFCGGEELELENRNDVFRLLKRVKECCKDKTIWLYSAFLYEDIKNFDVDILSYVDVLVDGPFVDGLKDRKLRFRGSSNQRIIDVPKSLENDKIVLYVDSRFYK